MTDMVERLDLPTALKLLKEREIEIERLRTLAAKVCWFDWSNNDSDAVEAVADLRKALSKSGKPTLAEAGYVIVRRVELDALNEQLKDAPKRIADKLIEILRMQGEASDTQGQLIARKALGQE